jgi:hypothetical protein
MFDVQDAKCWPGQTACGNPRRVCQVNFDFSCVCVRLENSSICTYSAGWYERDSLLDLCTRLCMLTRHSTTCYHPVLCVIPMVLHYVSLVRSCTVYALEDSAMCVLATNLPFVSLLESGAESTCTPVFKCKFPLWDTLILLCHTLVGITCCQLHHHNCLLSQIFTVYNRVCEHRQEKHAQIMLNAQADLRIFVSVLQCDAYSCCRRPALRTARGRSYCLLYGHACFPGRTEFTADT